MGAAGKEVPGRESPGDLGVEPREGSQCGKCHKSPPPMQPFSTEDLISLTWESIAIAGPLQANPGLDTCPYLVLKAENSLKKHEFKANRSRQNSHSAVFSITGQRSPDPK